MVADKVVVLSKKAGEDSAFKWTSDGKSGYKIEDLEKDTFGTDIILYLNDEGENGITAVPCSDAFIVVNNA